MRLRSFLHSQATKSECRWRLRPKFINEKSLLSRVCFLGCVLKFKVPPTTKDTLRWGHSLKSHQTYWQSQGSNLQLLVYRTSSLSTATWGFHVLCCLLFKVKKSKTKSGIDTIKYHTWPGTPYGKVTKTQEITTHMFLFIDINVNNEKQIFF